ncbi:RTC4-like domain-containing protein [Panaeolus papilionaceus]|nr:RTC4-like domain-containing protein [Panaeolus papilionaceus]
MFSRELKERRRFQSGKRLSPGYSDEDRGSKKTKRDVVPLHDDTHADFYDEGDSILVANIADPKTLCPYCDTPLPSNPSPLLLRLLAATKEKSSRDPRPSNALGRKAPLGIFIVVCQRHQFESQILPEAELKGWPKSIDWKRLGSRVRKMKPQLQALINDADSSTNNDDWDIIYSNSLSKTKRTPRSRCIFWQEIIEEVKTKGTRSVTGVRGQFANFEKAQPGYYGELGSAIIQQTLYDLFPPDSVDPAVFMPLTANEFVQRVLVPEVAVRLVMEDQSLSGEAGMKTALTVLRESSSYGAAMFPDDSAEAGKKKDVGLEASEQIVFDRAMKRRKELEEQDLLEEQARQEEEAMDLGEAPEVEKTGKRKATRAGAQESDGQDSDYPPITAKPRPRPKPIAKTPSSTAMDATTARPARTRSRTTRSTANTDVEIHGVETTAEMSSYDSDIGPPPAQRSNAHRATSEARRRSPSISESQPVPPLKPRPIRSTKGSFASLSLSDSSESEKSTKSVASKKTRSSSRTPAAKPPSQQKVQSSSDMDIDSDSSGPEIIKTDNMKTPKPRPKFKPEASLRVKVALNDNTPKPATKTLAKDADLPPLLRARNKRELASSSFGATNVSNSDPKGNSQPSRSQQDFQVNYSIRRAGPPVKQPSQDFTWLLDN